MFSGHCFQKNCQDRLFGKCECEEAVLFCQAHAFEHLLKPSIKGHKCNNRCFKPAEEIKQPLIIKLTELREQIQNFKKGLVADASEVISKFEAALKKYLNQVNDFDEICSKIIQGVLNDEEFLDIADENNIENVVKLNEHNFMMEIDAWNTGCICLDYKDINAAINKIYEIPFIPFDNFGGACKNEIRSSELSFFRNNTKNFTTINLDNFEISSIVTLETQEKIHAYSSKCILPDQTYFYCCDPSSNSGMVFTIDKYKNVKQLQKSKLNSHLDAVYYENFIYLLGGNNKLAERYNLKQDCWESVAPLPQDFDTRYSYSILFGNIILITGYYTGKLISYNITQNDYKDVPSLALKINTSKLMMRGNNRVYLFEKRNRNFESAENDISRWTHIGNNNMYGNDQIYSVVVKHKWCLYTILNDNRLWRFDLSSKQLSEVKVI